MQKINKQNAWTVSIIDSFFYLVKNHHEILENFATASSSLEASTKVYSLRVESLHDSTIQLKSDLSRQTAKSLEERLGGNQDESQGLRNVGSSQPKQKKRRNLGTITNNKETLNGKIQTVPVADPFFAKQNFVIDNINGSKRLLLNALQSASSVLKLSQIYKFWDGTPANPIDIEFGFNVAELPENLSFSSLKSIRGPLGDELCVQGNLSGYVISDLPMEEDDIDDSETEDE